MGLEQRQEKEKDKEFKVQLKKGKIRSTYVGVFVACISYCRVFQLGNRLTTLWAFLLLLFDSETINF